MMKNGFFRVKFFVFAAVLLLNAALFACANTDTPEHHLKNEAECVFFINVGRGDAIFIRTGGRHILIDAGSKAHSAQLLAALERAGVERLDALVVTHSNKDHFSGVKPLSEAMEIGTVYYPEYSETNKDGENKLAKQIKKLGLDNQSVKAGDTIELGGTRLDVLGPVSYNESDENDNSVVLRAEIGGMTYLFTGDMQFAEEEEVIATGAELDCDVLKVPNHGHADATSEELAALASPSVSVVTTSRKEDNNTASTRVRDILLAYGEYHITEDAETGILVYADSGKIKVLYV